LRAVIIAATLLPTLFLVAVYLYVLRTRLVFGSWPSHNRPDPRDLPFVLHHTATWWLLISPVLSASILLLALPFVIHAVRKYHVRFAWWYAAFFVTLALNMAAGRLDPGHFIDWFLG
jgi:hypothetical protein